MRRRKPEPEQEQMTPDELRVKAERLMTEAERQESLAEIAELRENVAGKLADARERAAEAERAYLAAGEAEVAARARLDDATGQLRLLTLDTGAEVAEQVDVETRRIALERVVARLEPVVQEATSATESAARELDSAKQRVEQIEAQDAVYERWEADPLAATTPTIGSRARAARCCWDVLLRFADGKEMDAAEVKQAKAEVDAWLRITRYGAELEQRIRGRHLQQIRESGTLGTAYGPNGEVGQVVPAFVRAKDHRADLLPQQMASVPKVMPADSVDAAAQLGPLEPWQVGAGPRVPQLP